MSCTVMVKEFVPVFPWSSVAEQLTVVVPSAKVEPEAGKHVTAGLAGEVSSVAVALKETTAPAALVASTVMLPGTVTTGGVLSHALPQPPRFLVDGLPSSITVPEKSTVRLSE